MPIYEYEAKEEKQSCEHCRYGFEIMQRISEDTLEKCPECGNSVRKIISIHSVGSSKSGFDQRAKSAGFHKLEKRDTGTYEKKY